MKNNTFIYAVLGAALFTTACGDDGGDESTAATTGNPPTTATDPGTTTVEPTTGGPTTVEPTTVEPTTVEPTTVEPTTVEPTTVEPTTGPDPTTGGAGGFMFDETPYDGYKQIDRHAAVEAGTAGIKAASGLGLNGEDIAIRDMYNASNPVDDKAGKWVPEIQASIKFFHDNLDDDIMALKLVPATGADSVAQAGPVIIPDTIKYDPTTDTAYPNGRKLEDRVVDITLAAVLLKLGPNQPLSLFADIPLNPGANDVPFAKEFPYLAPPHKP